MDIKPATVIDIDRSMNMLKNEKMQLTFRKREIEADLMVLKNRVRSSTIRLPPMEYKDICRKQSEYKREILEIETKLADINKQLASKQLLRDEVKLELTIQNCAHPGIKGRLIKLRDDYMSFASDVTRVASMRAMASKMAEDIEAIIKDI